MTSKTTLAILAATVTAAVPVATVQAAKPGKPDPVESSAPLSPLCPDQTFARVFAPFKDKALYTLVDGGSFEDGAAGWELSGGAALVDDNETAYVVGAGDRQALELPPGASATSPATCVAHGYKSARLFARAVGARRHARGLRVEVVYTPAGGRPARVRSTRLKGSDVWAPTKRLSLGHGRFQKAGKAGVASSVQFRFTVSGAATWRIDDVHVDPRMKR